MKIYFWILPASHTYDFKKRVKNVLSMVFRNFPFNKIGSMGQNSGDFFHKILERKKKVDIFVSTMLVFGFVL